MPIIQTVTIPSSIINEWRSYRHSEVNALDTKQLIIKYGNVLSGVNTPPIESD